MVSLKKLDEDRLEYERIVSAIMNNITPIVQPVVRAIHLKEVPDIVDFKQIYSPDNGSVNIYIISIMKFADGTETKAKCKAEENDMYTGFITCYCKKVLGSDFNKTVTYWTEKKPALDAKEQDKKLKEAEERKATEQRRIDKAKRRKYKRMVKQKEINNLPLNT